MAHDFLGTFNRSQFERFLSFARAQLPLVAARIQHLEAQIQRVGVIIFRFDNGVPQGYAASPPESYIGKLLGVYEVLGGNPFIDLRVRLKNDPVYMLRGTETNSTPVLSNGVPVGAKGLSDGPTAELVRQARTWLEDTLQGRFDGLERKIRRMVDYSDQMTSEVARLKVIQQAATTTGSLEYIAQQVGQFISDNNYRAVYDDAGGDQFGIKVYAPFSSYDTGPGRTADGPQRQNTGFVESGGGS